jgi:hypothetical protein
VRSGPSRKSKTSATDFRFLADELPETDPAKETFALTSQSKDEADAPLQTSCPARITARLVALGFPTRSGAEMHQDIVKAVRLLCDVAIKVEGSASD